MLVRVLLGHLVDGDLGFERRVSAHAELRVGDHHFQNV